MDLLAWFRKTPKPNRSFERQLKLEREGASAFFDGKSKDSVPYETDSFEWNHWWFGYDIAKHEMEVMQAGVVQMIEVGEGPEHKVIREFEEPVFEAIRNGHFKPRFVEVSSAVPSEGGDALNPLTPDQRP